MTRSSAMVMSAAVVLALAACESIAPSTAAAQGGPSCKNEDNAVITGSYPVYSYWCHPTTPGHSGQIQLDVYIYNNRNGPTYHACTVPPLPPLVEDLLCPAP